MIQAVYNHLLTCYSPKQTAASNNTHKRSELRRIYNHIIKVNKNAPLYRISMSDDSQLFAIGLKEASMELNNVLSSFIQPDNNPFDAINAHSSNPEIASVSLLNDDTENLPESFTLEIANLAKSQINSSIEVPIKGYRPKSGSYRFIAKIDDEQYEFQFKATPDDDNQKILANLSDLINKADIGLSSFIHEVDSSHIELHITSNETGDWGEKLFELRDTDSPANQIGLVEYYGLNNIVQNSSNASFSINGEKKEATNNQLILNRCLKLNLSAPTDEPVKIGYIPDSKKILSSVEQFTDTYNHIIQLAREYPSHQGMSRKLIQEIKHSLTPFKNDLESCGIEWNEKNQLTIDKSLARQAIEEGDMQKLFSKASSLVSSLMKKSAYITINPIDYVDKTLITYPNFQKPGINHPYASSIYGGLLFNYYC
ncbi:hypothetical protein [Velocimicrobium porci]|uniref:Uncharacterized protein n=1 Tax=Velocimicrobium porci TaxID=2606634 RepID=A0A6L5XVJ3_9FIRM|nr:hypothetical protein [Velocimicrobium porci]MSS62836.1 hypothetical protein [Velocimicrobium porci]